MRRSLRHVLAVLTTASAFAAQAAPNLVVNGSFESLSVANATWINSSTLSGWSLTAGPGTGFEVRNGVAGTAFDGRNFIELDTNGNTRIAQSFNGLLSGGSYLLSFAYAPRATVAAASNGVEVFWNGQQLGSTLSGSTPTWTQQQFNVLATGSDVLSFRSVGPSDGVGGSLDAVSLTSAVPEPATVLMLAAGLALLARRRLA